MYLKGYEIIKKIGTMRHHDDPESIEANVLLTNDGKELIDIRRWTYGVPGEGITMTKDLAEDLSLLLQHLFKIELADRNDSKD